MREVSRHLHALHAKLTPTPPKTDTPRKRSGGSNMVSLTRLTRSCCDAQPFTFLCSSAGVRSSSRPSFPAGGPASCERAGSVVGCRPLRPPRRRSVRAPLLARRSSSSRAGALRACRSAAFAAARARRAHLGLLEDVCAIGRVFTTTSVEAIWEQPFPSVTFTE